MHDQINLMVVPRGFDKVRVMQYMWISPFSEHADGSDNSMALPAVQNHTAVRIVWASADV